MTTIEAGIIAGIPTGATIGVVLCKSHGVLGVAGGSLAGIISGGLMGAIYASVLAFLLCVISVLWRAVQKRRGSIPSEADMKMMDQICVRGVFLGLLMALIFWFCSDWLHALLVAFAFALITAFEAVARCELRR